MCHSQNFWPRLCSPCITHTHYSIPEQQPIVRLTKKITTSSMNPAFEQGSNHPLLSINQNRAGYCVVPLIRLCCLGRAGEQRKMRHYKKINKKINNGKNVEEFRHRPVGLIWIKGTSGSSLFCCGCSGTPDTPAL